MMPTLWVQGDKKMKMARLDEDCRFALFQEDLFFVFLFGSSGHGRVPQLSNMGNDCLYISDGVGHTASPSSLHGAPLQPY